MKYIILILFFFLCNSSQAQQGVYISSSDTVNLAGNASVFNDLLLKGTLLTQKNTIHFYGGLWENASFSSLLGNGIFYFSGNKKQWIASGYRRGEGQGPSFPNIVVDNPEGLYLADLNDLHIRHNLHFLNGSLYLNGWNLAVDDSVTGYTDKQFVITGGNIGGGSLFRKAIYSNKQVFPIGTSPESYSPIAIESDHPVEMEIGASVFDHVYEQVTGGDVMDSTHVMKTWQLIIPPANQSITVWLQHQADDEGFIFSKNRDSSYISVYDRTTAGWDEDSLPGNMRSPGELTTGNRLPDTYMIYRALPSPSNPGDSVRWLSIGTQNTSSGCPVLRFNLWKPDRYNYKWVQIFWRTQYEINVSRYEVQVRRDTAARYQTVTTIASKSQSRPDDQLQYYYYADENDYNGISYYRLKIVSPNGCITYTNEEKVQPGFGISVWPNPASDHIDIKLFVITRPLTIQLVNTAGQVRKVATISGEGRLDVKSLPDGVYYLIIRDPGKAYQTLSTTKIVIQHSR